MKNEKLKELRIALDDFINVMEWTEENKVLDIQQYMLKCLTETCIGLIDLVDEIREEIQADDRVNE